MPQITGSNILALFRRGILRIWDFRGRDSQRSFWAYAIPCIGILYALFLTLTMPTFGRQMVRSFAFASEQSRLHPEDWHVTYATNGVSYSYLGHDPAVVAQMMPDPTPLLWPTAICALLAIILLSAAAARRLHDRGHSGFWLLGPIALLIAATVAMFHLLPDIFHPSGPKGQMAPQDIKQFLQAFLIMGVINLAYLGSLGAVALQCVLAGKPGPNRYGEMPAA